MATAKESKDIKKPNIKQKTKEEAQYERDHKMVKGKFTNHEVPGGFVQFSFVKYKEDPQEPYTLFDGKVHEVPYMVAEHINNKCGYAVHKYHVDEDGNRSHKVGRWVNRFSFTPLDMFDAQLGPKPELVTVEKS